MKLLEAGKIVSTHGVRGELRVQPMADSPEFLLGMDTMFLDGNPVKVLSARAHKQMLLLQLEGIADIGAAQRLKGKTLWIDPPPLPPGRFYIRDLIGLSVLDADTGVSLGTVKDVWCQPAQNVLVIEGEREILVPHVDEFVKEIDLTGGFVRVRLIDGM